MWTLRQSTRVSERQEGTQRLSWSEGPEQPAENEDTSRQLSMYHQQMRSLCIHRQWGIPCALSTPHSSQLRKVAPRTSCTRKLTLMRLARLSESSRSAITIELNQTSYRKATNKRRVPRSRRECSTIPWNLPRRTTNQGLTIYRVNMPKISLKSSMSLRF